MMENAGATWHKIERGTVLGQRWYQLDDGRIDWWVLTPLKCPDCGDDWAYYAPVPSRLDNTIRGSMLTSRREALIAREYRCDDCWDIALRRRYGLPLDSTTAIP